MLVQFIYECDAVVGFLRMLRPTVARHQTESVAPQTNSPLDSGSGGKDTTPSEPDAKQDESLREVIVMTQ